MMSEMWFSAITDTGSGTRRIFQILVLFVLAGGPVVVGSWILYRLAKPTVEEPHKELGREDQSERWNRHRLRKYTRTRRRRKHHR